MYRFKRTANLKSSKPLLFLNRDAAGTEKQPAEKGYAIRNNTKDNRLV